MTKCLDIALSHVSIRKFKAEPIREDDVKSIELAALRAPSSWGLQPVTLIKVYNKDVKKAIADAVGGQEHVAEAPLLLVFALDFKKLFKACELAGIKVSQPKIGHIIAGVIDVAIASSWASLVAEELGYGVTFIALYSNPCKIADLLRLPDLCIPLIGLTIGKPDEKPKLRPRLPKDAFSFKEIYGNIEEIGNLIHKELTNVKKDVWNIVLTPNGYYDEVSTKIIECLRVKGFKV